MLPPDPDCLLLLLVVLVLLLLLLLLLLSQMPLQNNVVFLVVKSVRKQGLSGAGQM